MTPRTRVNAHPVVNIGTGEKPQWVRKIGGVTIDCDPPPGTRLDDVSHGEKPPKGNIIKIEF